MSWYKHNTNIIIINPIWLKIMSLFNFVIILCQNWPPLTFSFIIYGSFSLAIYA